MLKGRGLWRGKRKDNGEWVEGMPYDRFMICGMDLTFGDEEVPMSEYPDFDWVEIDPETLGECTGLFDKNGKRIFEGDIVVWDYDEADIDGSTATSPELVKWVNHYCGFAIDDYTTIDGECRVIGNIYDNPELLEGGENNG